MRQLTQPAVPTEERARGKFFSLWGRHLSEVYRYVRRQLGVYETANYLQPGDLTAEEVVDDTLLRAYRDFVRNPVRADPRHWLLRLAERRLQNEVRRLKAERAGRMHLEEVTLEPTPLMDSMNHVEEVVHYWQPHGDLRLEEVLPDLTVPTPEQGLPRKELQRCLQVALARLPRGWRQALVLCHQKGFREPLLAEALRIPQHEAERDLVYARAYVRQTLREAGCVWEQAENRIPT